MGLSVNGNSVAIVRRNDTVLGFDGRQADQSVCIHPEPRSIIVGWQILLPTNSLHIQNQNTTSVIRHKN